MQIVQQTMHLSWYASMMDGLPIVVRDAGKGEGKRDAALGMTSRQDRRL